MSRLTKEEILEKYGPVEGEKRWVNILRSRTNRANNPEYGRAYAKKYRNEHKDETRAAQRKWLEAHRDEHRTKLKQYYQEHKEKISEQHKEHRATNALTIKESDRQRYYGNQLRRAQLLVRSYKAKDLERNRGECTLTPEWVVENIFASKCVYCGCDDWTKLGCDRIDNSKAHTPENVVCSCWDCNSERKSVSYQVFKAIKAPLGIKIVYSDD